jgi:GH25 family lysozyme M1 (1,4-beta-N-acetylmuramidase)
MEGEDENTVSLSSVAHAMLALETEIKSLQEEADKHYARMSLAYTKMQICRDALQKILAKTQAELYASYPDTKNLRHKY